MTDKLLLVVLFSLCIGVSWTSVAGDNARPSLRGEPEHYRRAKQFEFLSWLFGERAPSHYRIELHNHTGTSENDANGTSSSPNATSSNPNATLFRVGPFVFTDIKNTKLQRANLTPEFEKIIRDDIFRNNEEHSAALTSTTSTSTEKPGSTPRHLRFKRRSGSSRHHDRDGDLDSKTISKRQGYFGGMTPQLQQEMLLLQQQAALRQQQQLYGLGLGLQNQSPLGLNQGLGGYGGSSTTLKRRKRPIYEEYDDDDDSDEFDFDSDEFMSYPLRSGFMQAGPFGGFRG